MAHVEGNKGRTLNKIVDAAEGLHDQLTSFNEKFANEPRLVSLTQTATEPTKDQALWSLIRHKTDAIAFKQYDDFVSSVLSGEKQTGEFNHLTSPKLKNKLSNYNDRTAVYGTESYQVLKLATEVFLLLQSGFMLPDLPDDVIDEESGRHGSNIDLESLKSQLAVYLGGENGTLPYLDRILNQIENLNIDQIEDGSTDFQSILSKRISNPILLELIWSYWHEEAMMVQTMNLVSMRFQNKRSGQNDPLANIELDPLRPLNNVFWGYMQEEYSRLSIKRRAYEYDHHYGIRLVGKAVDDLAPVDSRSKFIEAFHMLLHNVSMFYREDDDTTIVADAFKLLNNLREVHLILSEGAHNQYGDLPWTSRKEMMIMQWMLARPEMKEFLRGRYMTPYQENWMGAVDSMKKLQGWSDTSVTHFHELARYGEQIILTIRFGDWIDINDQEHARNWARYWRPEIQRYIHAYNAVSGVDLSTEIIGSNGTKDRFSIPSVLLNRQLQKQSKKRGTGHLNTNRV